MLTNYSRANYFERVAPLPRFSLYIYIYHQASRQHFPPPFSTSISKNLLHLLTSLFLPLRISPLELFALMNVYPIWKIRYEYLSCFACDIIPKSESFFFLFFSISENQENYSMLLISSDRTSTAYFSRDFSNFSIFIATRRFAWKFQRFGKLRKIRRNIKTFEQFNFRFLDTHIFFNRNGSPISLNFERKMLFLIITFKTRNSTWKQKELPSLSRCF